MGEVDLAESILGCGRCRRRLATSDPDDQVGFELVGGLNSGRQCLCPMDGNFIGVNQSLDKEQTCQDHRR